MEAGNKEGSREVAKLHRGRPEEQKKKKKKKQQRTMPY